MRTDGRPSFVAVARATTSASVDGSISASEYQVSNNSRGSTAIYTFPSSPRELHRTEITYEQSIEERQARAGAKCAPSSLSNKRSTFSASDVPGSLLAHMSDELSSGRITWIAMDPKRP